MYLQRLPIFLYWLVKTCATLNVKMLTFPSKFTYQADVNAWYRGKIIFSGLVTSFLASDSFPTGNPEFSKSSF